MRLPFVKKEGEEGVPEAEAPAPDTTSSEEEGFEAEVPFLDLKTMEIDRGVAQLLTEPICRSGGT